MNDLKSYWDENTKELQDKYPGIRFNYFQDVFESSELCIELFKIEIEKSTPLDYISKTRNFAGYDFYVDARVLIPRYETELLYEIALEEIQRNHTITKFCEVGVGSGCLGLSLLASYNKRSLEFTAIDISSDAMNVFERNRLGLNHEISIHKITEIEGDRLAAVENDKFDLIISNPPYIKTRADKVLVHQTTLHKEPHIALFIDDEEYDQWFNQFFSQVFNCLSEGAYFMMEGHEDHLQSQALNERGNSQRNWQSVEVKQDLTRRDRFLILRK